MSVRREVSGHILGAAGWVRGRVAFGSHIEQIDIDQIGLDPGMTGGAARAERYILPGFIDLHVHGGGGVDLMAGGDAAEVVGRLHGRHGTTALLATTMTAPSDEIARALAGIARVTEKRAAGSARVLGVHLEGPYISAQRLGAQPQCARAAAKDELERYFALAPVRLITLAPEVSGHLEIIAELAARGVRVQIGHTAGSYEDGVAALAQGASGFTHLFNAMTAMHHREPGMVGAALAHATYAELIPDLLHAHKGAILAALRAIPRLFCVTDATAGAGMPDGEYRLGSSTVIKCLGASRLADGTIAGSTLTMDQALRNLVSIGLTIEDASRRLSRYPAEYLGLTDRGRIERGAWADLVVLDRALDVITVIGEGETLWNA
jgi:N-acetylglucosamine-6-phosphate deacetylase